MRYATTSLLGHTPSRGEAREAVAGTLGGSSQSGGFRTTDLDNSGAFIPFDTTQITHPENRSNPAPGDPAPTLPNHGHAPAIAFEPRVARDRGRVSESTFGALTREADRGDGHPCVAFNITPESGQGADLRASQCDTTAAVTPTEHERKTDRGTRVVSGAMVRRLTPRECERLQGFPDDYTLLPGRTADGPRYKAVGNSMAVPVIRWLGRRIELVDKLGGR